MPVEKNSDARGTIATVVATAAVTLAIGVTAAALGGYLVPPGDGDKIAVAQRSEPLETSPAPQTGQSNVVLVPIAPDGTREPSPTVPALQEPEVRFAVYDTDEHDDDDYHARRHRERDDDDQEEVDDHDDDD